MMVYFTLNENLSDLIFILASAENLRVRKIHALAIVFLQTLFLLFHKQSEKYGFYEIAFFFLQHCTKFSTWFKRHKIVFNK